MLPLLRLSLLAELRCVFRWRINALRQRDVCNTNAARVKRGAADSTRCCASALPSTWKRPRSGCQLVTTRGEVGGGGLQAISHTVDRHFVSCPFVVNDVQQLRLGNVAELKRQGHLLGWTMDGKSAMKVAKFMRLLTEDSH